MSAPEHLYAEIGARRHENTAPARSIFGDMRCLDRQLAGRLAIFFGQDTPCDAALLTDALALRQWEMLCRSLCHAASNSLHYREHIGFAEAYRLLMSVAEASGAALPESASLRAEADVLPGADPRSILYASQPDTTEGARLAACARHALAMTLDALPRTTASDLAANPDAFLAVSQGDVSGLISLPSSGTTGGPGKRIFCTSGDLACTAAFFEHGMRYMVGPDRHDHVALLMSGDRPGSVGDLLSRGMRDLGVQCSVPGFVDPSPGGDARMLAQLAELRPTCLVGVPSQLLGLARSPDVGLLRGRVHSILLSGDAVTPTMRQAIAEGFACDVFIHYGLTETGLGGAVECPEQAGCHMREADMIYEITDAEGRPLPSGEWGEIVITTLTRQAMPLLRYRTGDEGRILAQSCTCGSVFRRLQIRGRMCERVALPNGSSLHSTDFDRLLYTLPFIQGYTAVLHQKAGDSSLEHSPNVCLILHLLMTADAPEDALQQARQALTPLHGIVLPEHYTSQLRSCAGLPVLLKSHTVPADASDAARTALIRRQAKQCIQRTLEPPHCIP